MGVTPASGANRDDLTVSFGATRERLAELLDVALPLLETDILLHDHRNCTGGDFDVCSCMRDEAFGMDERAKVERLSRAVETTKTMRGAIESQREAESKVQEWLAHAAADPDAGGASWD